MGIWTEVARAIARTGPPWELHREIEPTRYTHTPPTPRAEWYADLKIVEFLENRIGEFEYLDEAGAAKCREAIDNCCDRIDGTGIDRKPVHLRGRINDMRCLKRLARNWADHPDFLPEWETP